MSEQEQINKLKSALTTLVDLKDHKDTHGKDDFYIERQSSAWKTAKSVLLDISKTKINTNQECSGCGKKDPTVDRRLFDGLCASCTNNALADSEFTKRAVERNLILIKKQNNYE